MDVIVYHGADLDGICSGRIAAMKYPRAKLLPGSYYNTDQLKVEIENNQSFIFVDYFPDDSDTEVIDMLQGKDVTIIDHHERLCVKDIKYKGIIDPDSEYGACVMTWKYLFPDRPVPVGVIYIGEHDVWNRSYDNVTYALGLSIYNTRIHNHALWNKILTNDKQHVSNTLYSGSIVYRHKYNWFFRYVRAYGIIGKVKGHKAIMVNLGMVNSSVFDSIDNSNFDVFIRATMDRDMAWKISLTSSTVDVREIAREYGGGGHKGASGCVVAKLEDIFTVTPDVNRYELLRSSNTIRDELKRKCSGNRRAATR